MYSPEIPSKSAFFHMLLYVDHFYDVAAHAIKARPSTYLFADLNAR